MIWIRILGRVGSVPCVILNWYEAKCNGRGRMAVFDHSLDLSGVFSAVLCNTNTNDHLRVARIILNQCTANKT